MIAELNCIAYFCLIMTSIVQNCALKTKQKVEQLQIILTGVIYSAHC